MTAKPAHATSCPCGRCRSKRSHSHVVSKNRSRPKKWPPCRACGADTSATGCPFCGEMPTLGSDEREFEAEVLT